jgi:ABC-type proline/glycine betaine transport system ATPase subunit
VSARWSVERLEASVGPFQLGPVDLALDAGHAVAVLGPSGAGKTTLLRALAGFLPIRAGRVVRDGVDVAGWLPEERGLGYVPQGLGLFPHRTVEGNVRYPMEIRGRSDAAARTRELLERFRLLPLAGRYPARLSGGEQQRVAIARALAAEPALLAWDEPWQGLDVLARHELGVVLHELREDERVPMVVVTHDPALAFSVADSFLVLQAGRVRAQCDAATLLRAPTDPFAARFVGFENVFDPAALAPAPGGSLRAWLAERAGPEGVAFASPTLPAPGGAAPRWDGKVRSARPGPHGFSVELLCDGLTLSVRLPPPVALPIPGLGTTVRFGIDPDSLLALGSGAAAGGGPGALRPGAGPAGQSLPEPERWAGR